MLKLLRHRGIKLSRESVEAARWLVGQVRTDRDSAGARCLTLTTGGGIPRPPAHVLYQPTIASIEEEDITLRGIELVALDKREAAVVQEWRLRRVPSLGRFGLDSPEAQGIDWS